MRNIELREMYYEMLYKIFRFDVWHMSPIEARPYGLFLVKKIDKLVKEKEWKEEIVEVGCGIGDILSQINYPTKKKWGYDIEKNVIRAARFVHRKVNFCVGSFNEIKGRKISLLIAVNFLHAIDKEQVQEMFGIAVKENNIEAILVDEVECPAYQYSHDYEKILGKEGYGLVERTRSFAAMNWSRRRFLLFEKK